MVCVREQVRLRPSLRQPGQPVPVGQCQDPALREPFLDGGTHSGPSHRRCPAPDATGEALGPVSRGGFHDVEDLLKGGPTVEGVRVRCAALGGERDSDRDGLRRGEVDRWQCGGSVKDVAPAGTGLRPYR